MANKLTCIKHGRRSLIMSFQERIVAIHRNGDRAHCFSELFTIGDRKFTADQVVELSGWWKSKRSK